MENIPFELIVKIMSFLPVMDSNKKGLNRDIIEYHIKTKWIKKYESIDVYSLDEDHDDYFYNWLENDIILALNNQLPLFKGLTTEFSNILKRIHNNNVTTYIDFDELDMQGESKYNVDLYFEVLNASELKDLDRRLEIYNYRLDSGFLAVPF
jgi:hypothetical protein|tara:strand:- start:496 stop:951 length:456 start_codon:yes stop_codon:yes gene_type:complete